MIIDANSYWFDEHIFHDETLCEQFLAEVPRAYDTEGYLTMNSAGKRQIVIEMPAGSPGLNYIEGDYTLEKRLADMDEGGDGEPPRHPAPAALLLPAHRSHRFG